MRELPAVSATACLKSFCRDPLVNSVYVYDRTATMWMTFLFGTVEHDVAPDVDDEIHIPLKPMADVPDSDVNVTLRIPVDDLYMFDELRDDPECFRSPVRSDDPHAAVLH